MKGPPSQAIRSGASRSRFVSIAAAVPRQVSLDLLSLYRRGLSLLGINSLDISDAESASILRSLTGGRGVHSEQFSRYEEMPREIEQRVIEEAKKARAAGNSSPAR